MFAADGEVEKSLVEQIPSLIHDLRNPLQQLSASMELYRSQVSGLLFGMLSGCIEEMNQLISQAMEKFEKISRKQVSSVQTYSQNNNDNEHQQMYSSKRTDVKRNMQLDDALKYEITDIREYLQEFWQRNLAVIELKQNVDYEILIQEDEMPLYFELPKLEVKRVLQNLFSNASKFTHNGYIKLLASFIQTQKHTPLQLKQQLSQQYINTKSGQLNQQTIPSKTLHFKKKNGASWKQESNQTSNSNSEGIQKETRTERWNEAHKNISKSDRMNNRSLSSSSSSSEEHNMSAMMDESSNTSKILGSFHNSTPPAFQVRTFSQITQASNQKLTLSVQDPPYKNQLCRHTNENSSGDIQLEQMPQIKQATSQMDESGSPHGQKTKKISAQTVISSPIQENKQQQQGSKIVDSPTKFQQIFSKRKSQIHPSIRDLVNSSNNASTMAATGLNNTVCINKTVFGQNPSTFQSEIKGYLKFEVADSGRGMTNEEMSKIFESFQQANPNIKKLYGGSGIGLFSAKTIAQKIGGDIICHSELNVGSSFIFYFPCTGSSKKEQPKDDKEKEENSFGLQESQMKITEITRAQKSTIQSVKNGLMKADVDAAIQRENTIESLNSKEKLDLGKIVIELGRRRKVVKLLYVDDSEFLLETMKNRLLSIGCVDVTIESSANKVINSYFSDGSRNNFDVILIDYSMNEMNGNQLAAAIKAKQDKYGSSQQKSILVCFTGYSINDKQFKTAGIESGFSAFLQKPASLLQVLTILLEGVTIQTKN